MADTASAPPPAALKRYVWADIEAMMRADIITEGGPEELLDGELWANGEPLQFTQSQVAAMRAIGVLGAEELCGPVAGEDWAVASEGAGHGDLKAWLNRRLVRGVADDVTVACETTLNLSDGARPVPDFYLFPADLRPSQVTGPKVLLLIEIADSSRAKDLKTKAALYRVFGVREYWVHDLEARVTHVHLQDGAWPEATALSFDAAIAPRFAPELKLRLADSGI
jgi:Uma2 family endonuclease